MREGIRAFELDPLDPSPPAIEQGPPPALAEPEAPRLPPPAESDAPPAARVRLPSNPTPGPSAAVPVPVAGLEEAARQPSPQVPSDLVPRSIAAVTVQVDPLPLPPSLLPAPATGATDGPPTSGMEPGPTTKSDGRFEAATEEQAGEVPPRESPLGPEGKSPATSHGVAGRIDPLGEPEPLARPEPPAAAPATDRAAEILRQIRVQLAPELRQASIQLQPPELGRLAIRLEVRKHRVRAEVVAEREETLAALERHAPELRAALAAAGFGQAELSLSLRSGAGRGSANLARHDGTPTSTRRVDTVGPQELTAALARTLAREGSVDTYA